MGSVLEDIIGNHKEIIVSAAIVGIMHKIGRMPTEPELFLHLGISMPDSGAYCDVMWKKEVMIRAYPPQIVKQEKGKTIVKRKIEEVWKKGQKGFW